MARCVTEFRFSSLRDERKPLLATGPFDHLISHGPQNTLFRQVLIIL